uniref:Immunoglobulin-like and fibronectin type III domain-containing protein 1-like n=1 Tax=Neolamprologus brichardi TaxID=32507 RepID=A0A3Q4H3P6_NEOBR
MVLYVLWRTFSWHTVGPLVSTEHCLKATANLRILADHVDPTASTAIRKRSKTSGVIITQYLVNMPEGKSTPDFQCKPVAVTIEKGKLAVFKAVVTGDPKPDVSWRRAKGTLSDKEKFQTKYDESTEEHILEIHKVSVAETDTYKCFAANEYGKAVCTTTLTVTEGKTCPLNTFKDDSVLSFFYKVAADGESDEMFWDAMLKADRNDYERICSEFGVKDLHLILKKLDEKKKERSQNKRKIKAEEREDALFECVLTHPLPNITWTGKGNILEDGEKYNLTMSDHKLIHRLLIKDCQMLDKGIYSAVVGNISCNAWLIVEDPKELAKKFLVSVPTMKDCDLRCAPSFIVPLKLHTAPKGYECYMSCAVKGNPKPRITWYRNHISLNTNTNYYISNTCGVCTMLILRVGPKDMGEYSVIAENSLGRDECSTILNVRGEKKIYWLYLQ